MPAVLTRVISLDLDEQSLDSAIRGHGFDEGIRATQLMLMQAGYRPFQEIAATQGPLLLDLMYPPYVAYGETMAAVRLAVATYSLLGILVAYAGGRLAAGRVGGVGAALLLVLSPIYLQNSRAALAETVALGPAMLAVAASLMYQRQGGRAWLYAAGVLLGIGLAVKPIVLAAAVPVALAALLRRPRALRDLLWLVALAAGTTLLACALVGLTGVLDQLVDYRWQARDVEGRPWSLEENGSLLVSALRDEQPAVFQLAIVAAVALVARSPRLGLALVAWFVASLLLLLFYRPLWAKHVVRLIPRWSSWPGAASGAFGS